MVCLPCVTVIPFTVTLAHSREQIYEKPLRVYAPQIPPIAMAPTPQFPRPGFQVEILTEALNRLGHPFEIQYTPFRRLIQLIKENHPQIALCVSPQQTPG